MGLKFLPYIFLNRKVGWTVGFTAQKAGHNAHNKISFFVVLKFDQNHASGPAGFVSKYAVKIYDCV